MATKQLKNQHLMWRAGFGVSQNEFADVDGISQHKLYEELEKSSADKPAYINVVSDNLKELFRGMTSPVEMQEAAKNLTKEQKKQIRQQNVVDIKKLNVGWMDEMINSKAQLREKMSLFWHGHFACRVQNIYYQQLLLDVVRDNALGNFGDLLRGVSKSASMLQFLNNQQNRKQHPNENFAREVMELFTIGRGNYTETDVKEGARAFTGWSYNLDGTFVFHQFAHDTDKKTFFGKTGNFDGDDILNILLEQKQTAVYITRKVYKYFVNDTVDEQKVQWLAGRFYQSNYDIKKLMEDIFTSDWFYDDKNIGTHIKSPVELLVGIRRTLPMELENDYIQLLFQRALGQLLFYPPNVAGWAGGKAWIDSSSLMLRLRIPQLIKDDQTFYLTPKADDDQQMGMKDNFTGKDPSMADNPNKMGKDGFKVLAKIDWDAYTKQYDKVPRTELYNTLQSHILQTPENSVPEKIAMEISSAQTKEDYIKTVTIALMSTPEYQLC